MRYETCFRLLIATGMRREECCGLKWSDFDFVKRKISVQHNVVKITGEEIIVKETKTSSGDWYV